MDRTDDLYNDLVDLFEANGWDFERCEAESEGDYIITVNFGFS
jgi:hypothetical protein